MKFVLASLALLASQASADPESVINCWSRGLLSPHALETTITVEYRVDDDGYLGLRTVTLIESSSRDKIATGIVFRSARRAIIRCETGHQSQPGLYTLQFGPDGLFVMP